MREPTTLLVMSRMLPYILPKASPEEVSISITPKNPHGLMNTQKPKQVITHRVEVDRISYEELQDQLDEMKANQRLILQMLADREVGNVYLDEDCLVSSKEVMSRLQIRGQPFKGDARLVRGLQEGRAKYWYDWCDYLSRAS